MKKFLINTLYFLLLVLVLLVIGEMAVRSMPNPYSVKKEAVSRYGRDTETLVLGASRSYYGIVADSLQNTLNLANISQNFEYDYRILEMAADSMPNLKTIVLAVFMSSFFEPPMEKGSEWGLENYYKIYFGIPKYGDCSFRNLELSRFSSYSGKLRNLLTRKKGPQSSPKGFGMDFEKSPGEAMIRAEAEKSAARQIFPHDYVDYNKRWFEKIAQFALNHNIRLILVEMPLTPDFVKALGNDSQIAMTKDILNDLQQRYHFEHYDFERDRSFGYDDFHDPDHLDLHGALKFTKMLRDSVLNVPCSAN